MAESATPEQLQSCIRDLMRLLALPAVWNGRDTAEILGQLCVALESALALEACYVSVRLRASEPMVSVLRIRGAFVDADSPSWQCLTAAAGLTHSGPPSMIDNTPIGALRMVSYDMGYFGEGSVCVASIDPKFPSATQALVLQAAVTLAASGLQSARLTREIKEAATAKDEFLMKLGHELRNPLSPIVTALSVIKMRTGPVLTREHQIIERQASQLTRLVNDLLDMSRLNRGKIELAKERVEMGEVVARAVRIAGPLLEQRGHDVQIDAPAGLLVNGDPARLAQIVANLLTNAAKYTEPGGHIAVTATRDNAQIRLSVKDDGAGIDEQLLPWIFDLFFQSGTTLDRKAAGLGVGLSLVKALVALHGGTVTATTRGPGRGSELVVTLPESPMTAAAAPERAPEARAVATRSESVVVVDDNRDAAELVSEMLSAVGHEVSVAHDALQALSFIARLKPTVVVLDIGLPVMDGYELARRIRDEFGENSPRLIAVTGYGLDQDKARSKEVGIDTHLVKPVDLEMLIAAVSAPPVA